MAWTVLPLAPEHAEAWHRLRLTLWPSSIEDDFATLCERYFTTGTVVGMPYAVFLAFDKSGQPIGFAEASLRPYAEGACTTPVGYLEGWFVVPGARRQGVGRGLVEACQAWATRRGCSEFASDTEIENQPSRRAHAALGFREVETIHCFLKKL